MPPGPDHYKVCVLFVYKIYNLQIESGTSGQRENLQLLSIAKEYQQTPLTCLRYKLINKNKSWFAALFLTLPLLLFLENNKLK